MRMLDSSLEKVVPVVSAIRLDRVDSEMKKAPATLARVSRSAEWA